MLFPVASRLDGSVSLAPPLAPPLATSQSSPEQPLETESLGEDHLKLSRKSGSMRNNEKPISQVVSTCSNYRL